MTKTQLINLINGSITILHNVYADDGSSPGKLVAAAEWREWEMEPVEIDFIVYEGSYAKWKIWVKCANVEQLRVMKETLELYMDARIAEAEKEEQDD